MKEFKIRGLLSIDCEWTVRVNDDEEVEDAFEKLVDKGVYLEEPHGDVERKMLDSLGYEEASMRLVWSSEKGKTLEYLFHDTDDEEEVA